MCTSCLLALSGTDGIGMSGFDMGPNAYLIGGTGIGALVGGAVGALAYKTHRGTGGAIGAVLGALLGGGVGYYVTHMQTPLAPDGAQPQADGGVTPGGAAPTGPNPGVAMIGAPLQTRVGELLASRTPLTARNTTTVSSTRVASSAPVQNSAGPAVVNWSFDTSAATGSQTSASRTMASQPTGAQLTSSGVRTMTASPAAPSCPTGTLLNRTTQRCEPAASRQLTTSPITAIVSVLSTALRNMNTTKSVSPVAITSGAAQLTASSSQLPSTGTALNRTAELR